MQEKCLLNVACAHSVIINVFFPLGEGAVTLSVQAWCQGLGSAHKKSWCNYFKYFLLTSHLQLCGFMSWEPNLWDQM